MTNYIGIDVGKNSLDIYFQSINKSLNLLNNKQSCIKLIKLITKYYSVDDNVIVVFEPTGGYERKLEQELINNNINLHIVHPTKVRSYAKAKGLIAKTDQLDAVLLADYAKAFGLKAQESNKSDSVKLLRSLLQRREQIIANSKQERSRLETESDHRIIDSINRHCLYLESELKEIDKLIWDLSSDDREIKEKIERLSSIPGVGKILSCTVIAMLPELGILELNQLTALVGIAPYARESGGWKGRRSIFAGRGYVRKILYMAAVACLRCNARLKAFYDRLIENHKAPKVALVAVMHKLLGYMHAIIKNNSVWEENYAINQKTA